MISIWIKHHWNDDQFSTIRNIYCAVGPDTTCNAPILGGLEYATQLVYCENVYNSTICESVQGQAMNDFEYLVDNVMTSGGALGIAEFLSIALSLYFATRILKTEILRTLYDLMLFLLLVPTLGCFAMGFTLESFDLLGITTTWIEPLFFFAGTLLIIVEILGFYGGKLKNENLIKAHIVGLFTCLLLFSALTFGSMYYSKAMKSYFEKKTDIEVEDIACKAELYGCCCCNVDNVDSPCPEWTTSDIAMSASGYLRIPIITALLAIVYVSGGVIIALRTFSNIERYKSELV